MSRRTVFFTLAFSAVAAGCATAPSTIVHQPLTARPAPAANASANGAIYQAGNTYHPLFEDHHARYVGDTLIIQIAEKMQADKNSETQYSKTGSTKYGVNTLTGLPGTSLLNSSVDASSAHAFDGKGQATANNDFTGTIAVTVTDVYPNGNLVVSGEKQIAMAQGTEYIRFSGVVDPHFVDSTNTINSTQVADARIEYKANGVIDEAQVAGWLARFFLSFLPF
ncbi:MAG TPA: flagellar basal body L-ring protein FlgH [Burkholderiales bacterium]|nr:flagellar basal body L-ring protein FlgH [Burkholderiales bacterium]